MKNKPSISIIIRTLNEDKIQRSDGFIHNAFSAYSSTYLKNNYENSIKRYLSDYREKYNLTDLTC